MYTTHYLEEVEELCDRIVIMDNGKTIANGTLDELKNMNRIREKIIIDFVDVPDNIEQKIKNISHVLDVVKRTNDYLITFENSVNNLNELILFINAENLHYTKLYSERPTLNDTFLELTGKDLRDK